MDLNAIVRVNVDEGDAVDITDFSNGKLLATSLGERDPFIASFLVAFAASEAVEFVRVLKHLISRHRGASVSLQRGRFHMTFDTNDPDFDTQAMVRLVSAFMERT